MSDPKTLKILTVPQMTARDSTGEPPERMGIEAYIEAAEQHGLDDDPDHEVGDLQDLLRKAWEYMPEEARQRFVADERVREILAPFGRLDDEVEDEDSPAP